MTSATPDNHALASLALERIKVTLCGPHLIAMLDHAPTKNALTDQLMHELNLLLDTTATDLTIRSLVLRGANGVFCAGADLKAALERMNEPVNESDPVATMNRSVGDLYLKLSQYPKAVVAVVEGPAFGGGFGMACCADIVIVGEKALFALSETSLGLPPGQIAPYVVARIGESGARRLALSGMRVNAEEALRIGLADQYNTADNIESELIKVLNMIGKCAPEANAVSKRIIQRVSSSTDETSVGAGSSIDEAARAFSDCLRSEEGREGVAAFNEKRSADWAHKI